MTDIDALWDFGDPDVSEARFREALAQCSDILEGAELRTQIARTLGLRGRFGEAKAELDTAEGFIGTDPTRAKVRLLLERGRCLNSSGRPAEAVPFFSEAVATAKVCGEPGLEVDAIHMLAIADSENAIDWNLKGIQMAESSSDSRATKWLASLFNNIGWTYFEKGEAASALDYFQRAVPLREAMGNEANLDFAKWSVARTLRELGRAQEALPIVQHLYDKAPNDPYNNQEMALCLVATGRPELAPDYATRAFGELKDDPWMKANRAEVLEALEALSRG